MGQRDPAVNQVDARIAILDQGLSHAVPSHQAWKKSEREWSSLR